MRKLFGFQALVKASENKNIIIKPEVVRLNLQFKHLL